MKNGFSMPQRASLLGAVLLLPLLASCGGKSSDAEAASTAGAANRSGGNRAGGEGGAPGAPGGGRGASTIMLAGNDVATVKRGPIESAVPVTGDLRPLEVIDVRARIEGELEEVLVREGQRVGAGQLLARFEAVNQQSDRASAEADLASARAAASTADWNAKQSDDLFKAGAISERDARAARNDADAARARVAAAQARVSATSTTARDTRVVAPGSGIVEKRMAEPGEHVTRGTTLFTVVRGDVLELTAAVPARLAGDVRPAQVVHFVADGRRFDGTVARVSPTVDPTSRTVTVYVQIPNPNGALKGNTFASGRVVARTTNGALLVPNVAVRTSPDAPDKPFVYKIAGDKLARTPVSIGIVDETAGTSEVLAGLDEGDKVVAGNVGTLGNGMKVQVLDADPSRRGGNGAGGRAQRTPS